MDTGLDGQIVVITGAAGGIGSAAARAFGAEGARLALVDVDEPGLAALRGELTDRGVPVEASASDLSTRAGVETGIGAALAPYGGHADILVNNVGICRARPWGDLDDDIWLATFQVNFMSAVRAIRAVLPGMRSNGGGVILNNASDLARQPEGQMLDYQVSKTAIISLTKSLALLEGPAIRVNAVAPGPIWTQLWTRPGGVADSLAELHHLPPEQAVEFEIRQRQLPMQRMGRAEEVAAVFVFLASRQASFVTGSVWGVDGGSIRGLL